MSAIYGKGFKLGSWFKLHDGKCTIDCFNYFRFDSQILFLKTLYYKAARLHTFQLPISSKLTKDIIFLRHAFHGSFIFSSFYLAWYVPSDSINLSVNQNYF